MLIQREHWFVKVVRGMEQAWGGARVREVKLISGGRVEGEGRNKMDVVWPGGLALWTVVQ